MLQHPQLDQPDDRDAWVDGDDHLLGPDLLVALVAEPGVETQLVRPPAGQDWIHLWTGAVVPGGLTAVLPAALDSPPLLLTRAGSAVPVDLATGGFRPGPYRRGLWISPLAGEGRFAWSFTEDDGERGDTRDDGTAIVDARRTRSRESPGIFGDGTITILLPPGEDRKLDVSGGVTRPVEIDGRKGETASVT